VMLMVKATLKRRPCYWAATSPCLSGLAARAMTAFHLGSSPRVSSMSPRAALAPRACHDSSALSVAAHGHAVGG